MHYIPGRLSHLSAGHHRKQF